MSLIDTKFWNGKRVFLTGHTGFKGSWLLFWLYKMGAKVTGYALEPETTPNMFHGLELHKCLEKNHIADIRDRDKLKNAIDRAQPEVVFHLAAQPIVLESYKNPVDTYSVNVMGTVNLLESCRNISELKSIIIVTTDKCYENTGSLECYKETDPMGGKDPYSSSKACAEIVTSAYRQSFFMQAGSPRVISARAGNVFGGGDWSSFRLIPDMVRNLGEKVPLEIRNPQSVRPWQFVTEPLCGYLMLAQGSTHSGAWNFGPKEDEIASVGEIVKYFFEIWGGDVPQSIYKQNHDFPREEKFLRLDSSKATSELGWERRVSLRQGLEFAAQWYKGFLLNQDMHGITWKQIQHSMM